MPASLASLRSGVTRNGCTVNMASGLSRPSRVLKKAAQRRGGKAQEALPGGDVEQPLPQGAKTARALVEGYAATAHTPLHARRIVVAQIFADARQVVVDLDAEPLEALRLADAGQLQQLRRGDGPGRHDHLTRCACLALLATHRIAHADAAGALHDQALGQRIRLDAEVRRVCGPDRDSSAPCSCADPC